MTIERSSWSAAVKLRLISLRTLECFRRELVELLVFSVSCWDRLKITEQFEEIRVFPTCACGTSCFFGELLGPIEDYRTNVSVCSSADPC